MKKRSRQITILFLSVLICASAYLGSAFAAEDTEKTVCKHKYSTEIVKATLTTDGKEEKVCTKCGNREFVKTIYHPETFKLSTSVYTYNGKTKKPSVTVKGSNGKTISSSNYSVTYEKGRKIPGKYYVKVKFKGSRYEGSQELYFTICPPKTSITELTSPKNGTLKIKWKKKFVTGYEIRYSKDKEMKSYETIVMEAGQGASVTISNLEKGVKYYVTVYTLVDRADATYYSKPSTQKSKTTLNVNLNETNLSLEKGDKKTLKISGTSKKVTWKSSNKNVATVSSSGKVTAKKVGTATITATVGGNKYTCKVAVRPKEMEVTKYLWEPKSLVTELGMSKTKDYANLSGDNAYTVDSFFIDLDDKYFSMKNDGCNYVYVSGVKLGDSKTTAISKLEQEGWKYYYTYANEIFYCNVIDYQRLLFIFETDSSGKVINWYLNNWPESDTYDFITDNFKEELTPSIGTYRYKSGQYLSELTIEDDYGELYASLGFWRNYGKSPSDEDFFFDWEKGMLSYELMGYRAYEYYYVDFVPMSDKEIRITVRSRDNKGYSWKSGKRSWTWSDYTYKKVN